MDTFDSFYKGKKVLVTGHTGFKGSWLTMWLLELGAEVIGYSLTPPTKPNLFNCVEIEKNITHIIGDVRNSFDVLNIFRTYKPELVFHLAAQSLVGISYQDPRYTYETNVMGTINILEAVRQTSCVRVIVNVTSDKCYENNDSAKCYQECDPLGGNDSYSASKACSEIVTTAYRKSFFDPILNTNHWQISLASVRAGNVIGGGDWAQYRLIPDCIKALAENSIISIRNPKALRPWQYVLEPLSGYLWLGVLMYREPKKYAQAWNFGPDNTEQITVEDILKKIFEIWGGGDYKIVEQTKFHEAHRLCLDVSKAQTYLNWRTVYAIQEALEKTVQWYQCYYLKHNSMRDYTKKQIQEYVDKAMSLGAIWT